ncbi:MAG: RNA polymerase Rpb4 family protein [Methanomassiliicoccaceae archaeon]|jgi:DNA-directed RNA polymerase subunit F|nr:RNA polymerase Rpb4 family protein [Methanomassiliicoccaceae archaeon]
MAERYVGLAEVKAMLGAESGNRELGTAQRSALEHSQSMVYLSVDDVRALVAELKALAFVTDFAAYKIGDILPKYPEDVRAIFSKERVNLSADNIKQIIEIVGKYL